MNDAELFRLEARVQCGKPNIHLESFNGTFTLNVGTLYEYACLTYNDDRFCSLRLFVAPSPLLPEEKVFISN